MSGKMKVHFKAKNGKKRYHGYTFDEVPGYKQPVETVETTEDDLAVIFENAKESSRTLDGADTSIDVAIEDPLSFLDYLVLDDGEIIFDSGYTREDK